MPRTLVPVLRAAVLVALAQVLAHEAVFLVRYGSVYGEALVHSGHGRAWSDAVTVVVLGSALLLAGSVLGLHRLRERVRIAARLMRSDRVATVERPDPATIARRWLGIWISLAAVVLLLLTVQENLEHAATGFGLPGPGILVGVDYPFAVAIVAAVAAAVGLVATLLSWRREVLIGKMRDLTARPARRVEPARPPRPEPALARSSMLGRRLGRRAPPVLRPA